MTRRYKLGCLVTHPIQYQAPMFRYLATDPRIELEVLFLSRVSLDEHHDPGFGLEFKWDVPLLEGYPHRFLECVGNGNRLSFWKPLTRGIRRTLKAGRYDALWVHGYGHQGLLRAIAAARALGIKVMLRGDSQLEGSASSRTVMATKAALLPRLFKFVDAFLAVGSLNREYYRYHGVPDERIFSTPYAVDNDWFRRAAMAARPYREELRRTLRLEAGRPVILYASKLQAHKRPGDLLAAFAQLARECDPIPYLLFAGDGEQRQSMEMRAAEIETDSVRFLGFRNQTELPALFDLCDVFVLPSEREPWGLIVNEVMSAGRAVVVSDRVGAAPDLVRNGVNGFVYPHGDIEALAQGLATILKDDATARRMGQASLELIDGWNFEADREGLLRALEWTTRFTAPTALNTRDWTVAAG
jgi:glycosyltransferase involved in cell wall biosynthesis